MNINRYFKTVLSLSLCISFCAYATNAESKTGLIVTAKKHLASGVLIRASDIERKEVSQSKVPSKSISSPFLIVGKKVKSELFKGEVIFDYNIDFDAKLSDSEKRTAKSEIEKAHKIWK